MSSKREQESAPTVSADTSIRAILIRAVLNRKAWVMYTLVALLVVKLSYSLQETQVMTKKEFNRIEKNILKEFGLWRNKQTLVRFEPARFRWLSDFKIFLDGLGIRTMVVTECYSVLNDDTELSISLTTKGDTVLTVHIVTRDAVALRVANRFAEQIQKNPAVGGPEVCIEAEAP